MKEYKEIVHQYLYKPLLWIYQSRADNFICRTSPLSMGDVSQDPEWVPGIIDSIKPVYTRFFLYIHTYDNV